MCRRVSSCGHGLRSALAIETSVRRQRTRVTGADVDRGGKRRAAAVLDDGATVGEGAAGGQIGQFRHGAGDGLAAACPSLAPSRGRARNRPWL